MAAHRLTSVNCPITQKKYNNNNNNLHMPRPVYEEGDVTVLWKQYTQRDKLQQIGKI